MDPTFVLCPNIIGLLALALLTICTRFNFYLDTKRLRLFIAAASCNAAIVLLEVTDYFLSKTPFASAYIARRLTSAMCFALPPVIPLFIAYIASKEKLPRWLMLPVACNVAICFCSVKTGHVFLIDACNSYYRGPLFGVVLGIAGFYLLLLIYISLRNLQGARAGEAAFLFGIVAVIIAANVLEIAFSFHFMLWNCCAVLLLAYYLFLHIQYFKFDQMTGVYNRNMFNFDVERLRRQARVGIASFDLNGLKQINDTAGHEQGDAYIIASAGLIVKCFRGVGHVYRVGGDEFVVLMSGTAREMIQAKLAAFKQACREAHVSIACGFSYADNARDVSQMLRSADDAMYDNKRNRIVNR